MKASILVLVHDQPALTRRCLESLRRFTTVPHELILIDNASAEPTRSYLRRAARSWPGARLLRNEANLEYAAAMNRAIPAARAPYQVWLNNDAFVGPEWLERLLAAVRSSPAAAAAGPCTNKSCRCGPGPRTAPPLDRIPQFARAWAMRFDGQREEADFLAGFCFLIKSSAVARVGLLEERLRWGYEDGDYSYRLRLAGCKMLLAKDVFVYHRGRVSDEKRSSRQRAHARHNRKVFLAKWFGDARWIQSDIRGKWYPRRSARSLAP